MVVGSRNTDQLNEMIFDGMAVRHELSDVWKNMPPITHNRLSIELSKSSELKEVLDFLDNTAMRDIEEAMRKQDESISSARRIIGLAKVDAAADEIIEREMPGTIRYWLAHGTGKLSMVSLRLSLMQVYLCHHLTGALAPSGKTF